MIAIINYGAGNLKSVQNALEFLGKDFFIADNPCQLDDADTLILPGVGAAKPAMQKLEQTGFAQYLKETKKPVIGICLGMQLMGEYSEEGNTKCLGVIPGEILKFPKNLGVKIPHIGWNSVNVLHEKNNLGFVSELFYFVHSYYFKTNTCNVLATCEYGKPFPAIVRHKNFTGIQFHPEKSGKSGLDLLQSLL